MTDRYLLDIGALVEAAKLAHGVLGATCEADAPGSERAFSALHDALLKLGAL